MIKNLYISGYRSYELNVFQDTDPKLEFIKKALLNRLKDYCERGLEWIITNGQLGAECWAIEVAGELREEYPNLKTSLLLPHLDYGNQWSEKKQIYFQKIKNQTDFIIETSKKTYENPGQLQGNQTFTIEQTDGALLLYDLEYPGKAKYLYDLIELYQENNEYPLEMISMYDLEDLVQQESEKYW